MANIKLNMEAPQWLAVFLRAFIVMTVLYMAFNFSYKHIKKEIRQNIAKCSTKHEFQSIDKAIPRSRILISCAEEKNSFFGNLLISDMREAINSPLKNPGELVGSWMSEQPRCKYMIELKANGEFKAAPKICSISNDTYTGVWSVHDGQMIWLYDASARPWQMDINDMEVIDEEFFMLTEHDGTRTRFRRVEEVTTASTDNVGNTEQPRLITNVSDMSGEDFLKTLRMRALMHDSLSTPQQPKAVVDARGWIDIWALQRDVAAVERLPRGNSDACSAEGEGDEEEGQPEEVVDRQTPESEAERKAEEMNTAVQARLAEMARKTQELCYADVQMMESAYLQAFNAFNAAWLEPLKTAVAKGDPVAEVVLRVCSTTDAIDRRGIDTDCTRDQAALQRAWQRLEEIGFAPALARLTHEDLRRMTNTRQLPAPMRQWQGQGPHSDDPYIAMLERQLDAIQKGDLSAGDNMGGYHCGRESGPLARGTPGNERCNYLYHMAMAVKEKADWFFIAGDRHVTEYNGELRLYQEATKSQRSFRTQYPEGVTRFGIKNVDSFRSEMQERLVSLDAAVEAYLRQEPRWAVFLMHRDGDELIFGAPPEPVLK